MLLERDHLLEALANHLNAAAEGIGSLILVAGEAGAGKTALTRAFAASVPDFALVIQGACDPLSTPRPLSPLRDFAADSAAGLDNLAFGDQDNIEVFREVLGRLRHTIRPILMIIEDIHWADQGTLDFLRFVGRRVADSKAIVVCTYRDDEIGPDHPLRPVLGQLIPLDSTTRVSVPMLSPTAVETLAAGTDLDPSSLHHLTDGNAFFVTEIIASGEQLPATVHDAVLARVATLDAGPREVVQAVSIAPRALEVDRALMLVGGKIDNIDTAVSSGVILGDGKNLRFRHELARSAVEKAVPPARRHELHSRMLALLLEEDPPDTARLAHHAIQARSPELIVQYAPLAAKEATDRGARKEAIELYRSALEHSGLLEPLEEADMRRNLGSQLRLVDHIEDALAEFDKSIAYYRSAAATEQLADALGHKQGVLWGLNRMPEGWEALEEAISILRPLGPSEALATALYRKAHHHMLARHADPAVKSANEALDVAIEVGSKDAEWLARMMQGCTQIVVGNADRGMSMLEQSKRDADRMDNPRFRTIALSMLGSGGGEARLYQNAIKYLKEGIEVGVATDEDYSVAYDRSWLARIAFEEGRWDDATFLAEQVRRTSVREDGIAILTAVGALGRVRVRRGDPGARETLEHTIAIGKENELQHVWSPISGLAEYHWMRDDLDAVRTVLTEPYERALDTDSIWAQGEIGFWMWKAGTIDTPPEKAAEPFELQMRGNWQDAANLWRDIGCPYEVGLALADGDLEATLEALSIFDDLGAKPMADRVRSALRRAGVESIPRGPAKSTKANPAGLTNRQTDVLDLMVRGLSNGEIAEELFISKKTVEHHVSAIFTKLGVDTRAKAITRSRGASLTK